MYKCAYVCIHNIYICLYVHIYIWLLPVCFFTLTCLASLIKSYAVMLYRSYMQISVHSNCRCLYVLCKDLSVI